MNKTRVEAYRNANERAPCGMMPTVTRDLGLFLQLLLSSQFSCLKYFNPPSSSCLKITALEPKSEMLTSTLMQPQTPGLLIQKKPHSKPLSWSKWLMIGTEKTTVSAKSAHVSGRRKKNPHYTNIWIWAVLEPGIEALKTARSSPTPGISLQGPEQTLLGSQTVPHPGRKITEVILIQIQMSECRLLPKFSCG